jgi:hypothetical protein
MATTADVSPKRTGTATANPNAKGGCNVRKSPSKTGENTSSKKKMVSTTKHCLKCFLCQLILNIIVLPIFTTLKKTSRKKQTMMATTADVSPKRKESTNAKPDANKGRRNVRKSTKVYHTRFLYSFASAF